MCSVRHSSLCCRISGSGFAERPGFQRLLTVVCAGTAGAVLALEASRLAGNDRDWSQLVELGAITNVVLIDHDGIYDPRLVNDRLLLGLKGIMSDFEMATLRQRALEAQRTKAQRGELWMHLPVGLVYGPTGAIELDPDARVQQAIRLVLQKFDELGSTRQVLLWLRRERISVPVTRGGKAGRYTEWGAPIYARVHAIVTNPFLAGAYVYGKSESRTTIVDGRIRRTSEHDLAVDQWPVVIPDHHPGYLDWASYRRHLSMIESNAYMKPGARKSARGGRSLPGGTPAVPTLRPHPSNQLQRPRQCLSELSVYAPPSPDRRSGLRVLLRQGRRRRGEPADPAGPCAAGHRRRDRRGAAGRRAAS